MEAQAIRDGLQDLGNQKRLNELQEAYRSAQPLTEEEKAAYETNAGWGNPNPLPPKEEALKNLKEFYDTLKKDNAPLEWTDEWPSGWEPCNPEETLPVPGETLPDNRQDLWNPDAGLPSGWTTIPNPKPN